MKRMIFALVLVLAAASANQAGEREKVVKGSVTASKIDADGKQSVSVTLEVKKGFFIYANPVDCQLKGKAFEEMEDERVNVLVQAKQNVKTELHTRHPKPARMTSSATNTTRARLRSRRLCSVRLAIKALWRLPLIAIQLL